MNNIKLAGWLSFLSARVKQLTLKYNVCYLSEGHFFRITSNTVLDAAAAMEKPAGLFVIIARSYYHEFSKTYPVRSKADLADILKIEYQDQIAVHQFHENDQKGFDVQSFVIKSDAGMLLNKPCFILPETWLLNTTQDEDVIILVEQPIGSYFTYRFKSHFGSMLKTSLCHDFATVRFIHGLPESVSEITKAKTQLPKLLANTFMQSQFRALPSFFYMPATFVQSIRWKPWAAVAGIFMVTYLSLASWVIQWQQERYSEQIAELGPEVDLLLGNQAEIDRLRLELSDVAGKSVDFKAFHPVWAILLKLIESGIEVRDFSINGAELNVSGQAERATEVLSTLIAMPEVVNAEFSAPTRRDMSKDQFSIRFTLKPSGAADAN